MRLILTERLSPLPKRCTRRLNVRFSAISVASAKRTDGHFVVIGKITQIDLRSKFRACLKKMPRFVLLYAGHKRTYEVYMKSILEFFLRYL